MSSAERRKAGDGRGRPASRVIMAGPARNVRGGVSAVVNALLESMPPDAPDVRYIATHVDGPRIAKLLAAVSGVVGIATSAILWRGRIVHVHMASHASFARKSRIRTMARLLGCRTIVHVHGAGFDVFYKDASPRLQRSIRKTLERADLVVALSDEWRARLARMAPRAEIRVLPNPVVVEDFVPVISERDPVPPRGGTVLFLGAFGKRKGVYDLIDAISIVIRERPDVVFELGGDQEVDEVRRLVDERGLGANVRMLGWVRGDHKLAAFARAHVYVLPSYHEGLPIGVLEALAAGLPVVTTPVGGIPEVIKDGVNGLMVSPGDVDALARSVLRFLGDTDLRSRVSRANIELARSRHDAKLVAATLCRWYNELS